MVEEGSHVIPYPEETGVPFLAEWDGILIRILFQELCMKEFPSKYLKKFIKREEKKPLSMQREKKKIYADAFGVLSSFTLKITLPSSHVQNFFIWFRRTFRLYL